MFMDYEYYFFLKRRLKVKKYFTKINIKKNRILLQNNLIHLQTTCQESFFLAKNSQNIFVINGNITLQVHLLDLFSFK